MLANNPTGFDGYIGEDRPAFKLSAREFLTRDEAEQRHKDYVEEQIKLIQSADALAQRAQPFEDSSSSEQDEELLPSDGAEEAKQEHKDDGSEDGVKPRVVKEAGGNQVRNKQMFFGGMPLMHDRPTLLKQLDPQFDQPQAKKKKFSTDAFLDLYFAEKNKKIATF